MSRRCRVSEEQPLGHPLAGDGREYRLYGTADLFDARLRLEADAFMRQRFETNLFGAYRLGRSLGASSLLSWRLHAHAELGARLAFEGGRGWRERNVSAMGTVSF